MAVHRLAHHVVERLARGLMLPEGELQDQISWLERWQHAHAATPAALLYGSPSVLQSSVAAVGVASVIELAETMGCRTEWITRRFGSAIGVCGRRKAGPFFIPEKKTLIVRFPVVALIPS